MSSPQTARVEAQRTTAAALRWTLSGRPLDFALAPGALTDIKNDLRHRRETSWGLLLGSAGGGKDGGRFVTVHESVPLYSGANSEHKASLVERILTVEDLVMGWCLSQQLPVRPVGFYVVASRADQPRLERELPELERYGRDQVPLVLCIRPASDRDATPALIARNGDGGTAELRVPLDFSAEWRQPAVLPPPVAGPSAPPAIPEAEPAVAGATGETPRESNPAPRAREASSVYGRFRAPAWIALIAAVVAAGAGAWWLSQRLDLFNRTARVTTPPAVPAPALNLQIGRKGGDLEITWSRTAPVLQSAQRGFLYIMDGTQRTQVFLEEAHLKTGRVLYVPRANDIEVRLEVVTPDDRIVRESLKVIIGTRERALPAPVPAPVQPGAQPAREREPQPAGDGSADTAQVESSEPARKVFIPPGNRLSSQPAGSARVEALPETGVAVTAGLNAAAMPPQTTARPALPPPPDAEAAGAEEPASITPSASAQSGYEIAVPVRKVPIQVPPSVRTMLRGEIAIPVNLTIAESGRVTGARAVQQGSSLTTYLANIAKNTAEQWRFRPAARNGRPVASDYTLIFRFSQNSATTTVR